MPGFAGDIKTDKSVKHILAAQYRTINRGGNSIYELIRKEGYDPCVSSGHRVSQLELIFGR